MFTCPSKEAYVHMPKQGGLCSHAQARGPMFKCPTQGDLCSHAPSKEAYVQMPHARRPGTFARWRWHGSSAMSDAVPRPCPMAEATGRCGLLRLALLVAGQLARHPDHPLPSSISALSRHRRRRVHYAGMGVSVLEMSASARRSFRGPTRPYQRNGHAVGDAEIEPHVNRPMWTASAGTSRRQATRPTSGSSAPKPSKS